MNCFVSFRCLQNAQPLVILARTATTSSSGGRVAKEDIKNIAPVFSPEAFPSPEMSALKRGTGGRSSFNGVVCTVLGASGAVGGNVVSRLGRTGSQVICCYRCQPDRVRHLKLCGDLGQILFQPFYLRDEESIYRAVKYSNVVVNCIGKDNETASWSFEDVNVEGARRVARICREAGVKRYIHISHLMADPDSPAVATRSGSRFLKTKYWGEVAVREEFPNAIIFRPSDIYGINDRFLRYFAHLWRRSYRRIALWKKGLDVYKMPVWDSDLAEGIVNAIADKSLDGKTIDAYGPKKYRLHDLVLHINQCIQKDRYHGWGGVYDLRRAPLVWIKLWGTEQVMKYPPICWDKVERENITDMPTPGNLTLNDLGVEPVCLEDKAKHFLWFERRFGMYEHELGEKPDPDPVPHYPILYPNIENRQEYDQEAYKDKQFRRGEYSHF